MKTNFENIDFYDEEVRAALFYELLKHPLPEDSVLLTQLYGLGLNRPMLGVMTKHGEVFVSQKIFETTTLGELEAMAKRVTTRSFGLSG